jgi:hypothetical protein
MYTKSAIAVRGNHFELQMGPNPARYDSTAESYTGSPALTTASHYRYDVSGLTGIVAAEIGILDGVIARDGHYDLFRNHPYLHAIAREDVFAVRGTAFRGPLTFAASASVSVMGVRDVTDASPTYHGEITVVAASGQANTSKKIAYKLFVGKAASGVSVTEISRSISTGSSSDDPNFTWSLDGTNNQLVAKAASTTVGDFYFTAQFNGNLIVG